MEEQANITDTIIDVPNPLHNAYVSAVPNKSDNINIYSILKEPLPHSPVLPTSVPDPNISDNLSSLANLTVEVRNLSKNVAKLAN